MEKLFEKFDQIRPLSDELRAYIRRVLLRKEYQKGEIILHEGEIPKYIFFIEKGLVKCYNFKKWRQRTSWLMMEGDFFVEVESFFPQTPSTRTIEAAEDCELYFISYARLQQAYALFPEFNLQGRKILEYYYVLSEKRNSMREQPAFDRFIFLMDNQPELVGRVKEKILASYLGMAPETFSVQKSKFAKRKRQKKI